MLRYLIMVDVVAKMRKFGNLLSKSFVLRYLRSLFLASIIKGIISDLKKAILKNWESNRMYWI